jgi:diaminopimelate epimerase
MILPFAKFQGTGNDFILVDNLDGKLNLSKEQVIHLCDRKFGIGSDGIVLIEKDDQNDFDMVFYNPDASQSFCGNGSRCAVKYASTLLDLNGTIRFNAIDGIHEAELIEDVVSVKMSKVLDISELNDDLFLDTGSPHFIRFKDQIDDLQIVEEAREVRYDAQFSPGGTNVNFVQLWEDGIKVRTYERGVENETLSCGTGVTACALASARKWGLESPLKVSTPGGNLSVSFATDNGGFEQIWLTGAATKVYEGQIEI